MIRCTARSWMLRVIWTASVAAILSVVSQAQSERRPMLTSHVPHEVASGVAPLVGHLPAQQRISLALSLPLRNQDQLERLLEDIYNPYSPSYRHFLSVDEFADKIWLHGRGLCGRSPLRGIAWTCHCRKGSEPHGVRRRRLGG